ncbi:MAG TPA: GAF domain-containing protein, partial [Chroococcales cyanobacterium]
MGQPNLHPHNESQLVGLGRVLQTLREEENTEVLIETTVDYLASELKYSLIWIGLYDRLEHRLYGKGGTVPNGETAFLKQRFNLNPGDLLEQVVIQQRFVGVPDLRQESRAGEWRRAAQDYGIQGTIVFPLRCKDRCFGVALLGSDRWGVSPHASEKALLSLLLGGLAAALYQIEVNWQRSAIKRPDQRLFQLLSELTQIPTLVQRLDAVVTTTQHFVLPTRTNLYWYSPEQRYFWHRVGDRQPLGRMGTLRTRAAGLRVAEASDFYQALVAGQLVAIGAGRSLLKSDSTERLLKRLRLRSLLAAPIHSQGELLGFLAVEDNEPRIWEEAEVNYVRAAAQILGLVASNEQLEERLEVASQDTHFTAEVAQAIARSEDTSAALKACSSLLCKRLDVERFLVLQEDDDGQFSLIFGIQPLNRRPLTASLPPLSLEDRQLLAKSTDTVTIEDLDEEVRFLPWRESLSQLGIRSLLACRTSQVSNPDQLGQSSGAPPLLVIAHATPRTWNLLDRELVCIVAQQINLLLAVGRSWERAERAWNAHQALQRGLSILSQAPLNPVQLERTWLEYLAKLLECPLAALIVWTPGSTTATIATTVAIDPHFALPPDLAIPIASNTLIQEALASDGFLCRSVNEFDASTHQWLRSPGIGQLLAIALHTNAMPTTGIVLLADHAQRQWPHHLLPPLETLNAQFAWFRYYQRYLTRYQQEAESLQTLNWYKHRCLETLHHSVTQSVKSLLELESRIVLPESRTELDNLEPRELDEINSDSAPAGGQPLQQMRRQNLLHQLEKTLSVLSSVLTDEQWQLTVNQRSIPLASLLKRSLRRVEPIYKQRQLMLQVHNPGKHSVFGDRLKLECILFELLLTSCFHAQPGSWINIWCCPVNAESQDATPDTAPSRPLLELLIAESGLLDDCLQALSASYQEPLP